MGDKVILHNTSNCYIRSDERIVGVVGAKDLVIVDTPDALLVADKSCTQDVKHIYAELKTIGHQAHKQHRTVYYPWGTHTVVEESSQYKIKCIMLKPGNSLTVQLSYGSMH